MKREIRPRFEVETAEDLATLMGRASRRLRSPDCALCGIAENGRIELYVPPARQRLWSPELRVDVRAVEGGTVLTGMYCPHPHVWMGYAAILALTATAVVAALTFALAEWMMMKPMAALYAIPPLALLGGITYALAFVGQGFAGGEMDELRAFLDDVVCSGALPSGVRHRTPLADTGQARQAG